MLLRVAVGVRAARRVLVGDVVPQHGAQRLVAGAHLLDQRGVARSVRGGGGQAVQVQRRLVAGPRGGGVAVGASWRVVRFARAAGVGGQTQGLGGQIGAVVEEQARADGEREAL